MQQKIPAIAIIIIILIFLAPFCYGGKLYQAEVVKLSDADSLWIRMNGIKIKLNVAGIDAPEEFKSRKLRRESRRCHIAQKYIRKLGRIATNYAKSILSKGDVVKIEIYKREEKGIYGLLFLPDGQCYSEEMVRQGYACVSDDIERKRFYRLEKLFYEAKKNKKGLWNKYYKEMDCLCRQSK